MSTKSETKQRVTVVLQLLTRGLTTNQIIKKITGNPEIYAWNVGGQQVRKYIHKAHEFLENDESIDRGYVVKQSISRYDELYKIAMEKTDIRLALDIEKDKQHLLRLDVYMEQGLKSAGDTGETFFKFVSASK